MRYSFSEENCAINIDGSIKLRSGKKVLYESNEASKMYNIIESCIHISKANVNFQSFYKIRFLKTLVIEYYSWLYKRSSCIEDRDWAGSQWQKTWCNKNVKTNWGTLFNVLTDKVNEAVDMCLPLNDSYMELNNMKRVKNSYNEMRYINICGEIKGEYGSMKIFNKCVHMCTNMLYFITTYFPNWVCNKLTQYDIQFELYIYDYKSWLTFKNSSKVLRNGKCVGPIIKPMRFYEGN
jgi:hypothetical protein